MENLTLLVGLSGGADSVALAELVMQLKPDSCRVVIAHFNHGWRGDESEADAAFCKAFATQKDCQFIVQTGPGVQWSADHGSAIHQCR